MPDSETSLGLEATVSLREITQETVNFILNLRVAKEQEQFVASNAVSIAEAHFSAEAWFRAIYADETPVGFLMLSDQPDKGEYFLWRFMVDAQHQGKGYGRRALDAGHQPCENTTKCEGTFLEPCSRYWKSRRFLPQIRF